MHGLLQTVNWAAPNVQIMELPLLPSTASENIMWRDPSVFIWHVIMKKDGMLNRHGPKASIRDIRPMDSRVKHHSSSNSHDGLDAALSLTVVMMSSSTSEPDDLSKLCKLRSELLGSEDGSVVSQEGLNNDSKIAAHQLIVFLCFQGLMGVEMSLQLDVNVIGRVIHEDTATGVHIILVRLPFRAEQTTFC